MKRKFILIYTVLFLVALSSCKQNEWLDEKRNLSDVVPSALKDYQALLDNDIIMNQSFPWKPLGGTDNYYANQSQWNAAAATQRNTYIWATDIQEGATDPDWNSSYKMIEYANIVLDGQSKITPDKSSVASWNKVKGSALFFRGIAFYNLAQSYARQYDAELAQSDPGIPLRLTSDVNERSNRGTVSETYNQILTDLHSCIKFLPELPDFQTRPSRAAAYGLLSRVYLTMGNYRDAEIYADSTLSLYHVLLDFNDLSASSSAPISAYPNNKEIIFYAKNGSSALLRGSSVNIDTLLYRSYLPNDLRKNILYNAKSTSVINFKGAYIGSSLSQFAGIAVNEIYLIKAECAIRNGNLSAALDALNILMSKRFSKTGYQPIEETDPERLLVLILQERRKELPMTGNLRWSDLRRLNKDNRFAITMKRIMNNQEYYLPPGDPKYVLQIPDDEIRLSGIFQNQR